MLTEYCKNWLTNEAVPAREKALAILLLTYFTGFLVTNLYLGSLGVIGLELLRVKYITSATLFLIFICSIFFPIIGVSKILSNSKDDLSLGTIGKIILHTFESFFVITIFVTTIGFASGTQVAIVNSASFENPSFVSELQIWANLVVIGIVLSLIAFVFLACLVGLLKILMGTREAESRQTKSFKARLKSLLVDFLKLISAIPWIVALFLLIAMHSLDDSMIVVESGDYSIAASHFLRATFCLYAIGTLILVFLYLKWLKSRERIAEESIKAIDATIALLEAKGAALLVFAFVLSIYSLYVYPTMPQQIGGGKSIPISLKTTNQSLNEILAPLSEVQLVDKTSTSIILSAKDTGGAKRIFELLNSAFFSIEYKKQ